jgi:hypothetical protein
VPVRLPGLRPVPFQRTSTGKLLSHANASTPRGRSTSRRRTPEPKCRASDTAGNSVSAVRSSCNACPTCVAAPTVHVDAVSTWQTAATTEVTSPAWCSRAANTSATLLSTVAVADTGDARAGMLRDVPAMRGCACVLSFSPRKRRAECFGVRLVPALRHGNPRLL